MAAEVKVQARVVDLIAAMEKAQKEATVEHSRRMVKYENDVAAWQADVKLVAERCAQLARRSKVGVAADIVNLYADTGRSRYSVARKLDLEVPEAPYPPAQPTCYDSRIKWLRSHKGETIPLTLVQYEAAMRGCW